MLVGVSANPPPTYKLPRANVLEDEAVTLRRPLARHFSGVAIAWGSG
jgi:hypothetical protein